MFKRIFIICFSIVFISFLLFAESESMIFKFSTEQEYKDFYYSLWPLLGEVYAGIKLDWVKKNTSQNNSDLNSLIMLANKEFRIDSKKFFIKANKKDIIKIIKEHDVILAKRSTVFYNKGIWITIVGYTKNVLIMNDSRSGPYQEISINDIGDIYILK